MDWIPIVLTFFLGLISALGIEFGKGQMERRQRQKDRIDDFQRSTLLELQAALYGLAWAAREFVEAKDWERTYDPDLELAGEEATRSEQWREALQKGEMLSARVDDSELRSAIVDVISQAKNALLAKSKREARSQLTVLDNRLSNVNPRIGAAIQTR